MGAGFGIGYGNGEVDTAPGTFDSDWQWFDAALSFSSGPWAISAGASYVKLDDGTAIGFLNVDQEHTAYSLSANYRIAPGLSIAGGATHWDIENSDTPGGAPNTNNSATTFQISTQVNF